MLTCPQEIALLRSVNEELRERNNEITGKLIVVEEMRRRHIYSNIVGCGAAAFTPIS